MTFLDKLKIAMFEIESQGFPTKEIISINSSFASIRFQFGINIIDQLKANGWNQCDETNNLAYFRHDIFNHQICCDKN